MVTARLGTWLSFVDMPWKAVTVGFAMLDDVSKRDRKKRDFERRRWDANHRPDTM
jgi:hypothetical protein